MNFDTVIGLEVHAQLSTKSKLFSPSPTVFGAKPNSQTSFIDAGLPGVLPVLNKAAVTMAIQFGLAISAEINDLSYFERKNYFYPDLPKGYQISQFQRPIVGQGHLDILTADGKKKSVIIQRAHLEEDAGKSLHEAHANQSGIDLNRAGTPLLEIVTTPCLFSAEEAVAYLKTLHQLVRFLGICDGNMQEGSFRCDVNLSLKPAGQKELGTRVELKNLNSFRFIEKAIHYEQLRQADLLESGLKVTQETRLYSPNTDTTHAMRSKENENDYRYFPDPDLLPIKITNALLQRIKKDMPPLPEELRQHLITTYQLGDIETNFLLSMPEICRYFDAIQSKTTAPASVIVNWLKGHYSALLNDAGLSFENHPISAEQFALLLDRLSDNVISAKSAKIILSKLMLDNEDIDKLISRDNLAQTTDLTHLEEVISNIIQDNPTQVAEYRAGKEKLISFFVGLVMKETKGQSNPAEINNLLKTHLAKS